jgi:pyruvate/2-oxoglutarate dehydrogenase complex dihydrolipoamide acyltransferase (E2) component
LPYQTRLRMRERAASGRLTIDEVTRKPIVVGISVTARSRATLSLIYDHWITDGVPAGQFLAHVKRLLENPDSLVQ